MVGVAVDDRHDRRRAGVRGQVQLLLPTHVFRATGAVFADQQLARRRKI